jgi:hypothetical protein
MGADRYEKSPGLKKSAIKYGPYSKNPVVASTGGPSTTGAVQPPMQQQTFNVNAGLSNQQNIRASDVYGANNYTTPWADAEAKAKAIADAALAQQSAFQSSLNNVGNAGGAGGANWQSMYNTAQKNLGTGYDQAKTMTDQGYAALQTYLQNNPNNPYAGFTQQVQPVANPMEQFLSSYGVGNEPVQAQVRAEQFAGEQGAGAFNSLVDILSRSAQGSDASRLAEMQMGQTMSGSGLEAMRANYGANNALELLKKRLGAK